MGLTSLNTLFSAHTPSGFDLLDEAAVCSENGEERDRQSPPSLMLLFHGLHARTYCLSKNSLLSACWLCPSTHSSPWGFSASLLTAQCPIILHDFYPNNFPEWARPSQVLEDNLGVASPYTGKGANAISTWVVTAEHRPEIIPLTSLITGICSTPSSCRLLSVCLRQSAAIFHVPILSSIKKKRERDGKYNELKGF